MLNKTIFRTNVILGVFALLASFAQTMWIIKKIEDKKKRMP